ncbi:UNVERIFIED_CONTAM: hypothetical protein HDU68_010845 [Siphonaria sp. JEL0065]|nr:hypothetical protein HDU68_010845 [Siphonaria sp. JEL0065]
MIISSASSSSGSNSFSKNYVAMTLTSLTDMFKESNAAVAPFLKSSFDGAAEDRQLRKKELELQERKLALEKRMEFMMMQLQNKANDN